jgi:hypothetical protein
MEIYCSEDVKELAGAMHKVQEEINPAIKDASNPFAKSRYAILNSVLTSSRGALPKHYCFGHYAKLCLSPGS